jgi:pyruvate kinase
MLDGRVMQEDAESEDRELRALLSELRGLRGIMIESERDVPLRSGPSDRQKSVRNLRHYLALRRRDVRPLQDRLARVGLSSLGRCEAHVLYSVDAVIRLLGRITGAEVRPADADAEAPTFDEGRALLDTHADALLGPRPRQRATRIMVTLSSEAADDAALLDHLLAAGMDSVRINCAHDDASAWPRMIENVRVAARKAVRGCAIHVDLAGPKIRTCGAAEAIVLTDGDSLLLTRGDRRSSDASDMPWVGCTIPSVLDGVRPGHPVWFDDGKLGGVVDRIVTDGVVVRITHARNGCSRLGSDRGINFPNSPVDIDGFTPKDREDLDVVAPYADSVALSFAQRPEDVRALQEQLSKQGRSTLGIVLKIETRRGFESLPRLLLEHDGPSPLGVMIARGDLAIEVGYERLAEVQEEILWICEAAHVPVIWATQVLETLSKDGMPTRAEVTDAAMAGRAECVMLNKGKHIVDSVRILDDILRRMEEHQYKKSATLRALHVSRA